MPTQPAILNTARLNNFRLNHQSPALERTRDFLVRIMLGGVDIQGPDAPTRVRLPSVTIRDILNDAPNTCTLTFRGVPPTVGTPLRILLNSNAPRILFTGELQAVDTSYAGRPTEATYPAQAIDDTARANRRQPFGAFTNTSATVIAQWLITHYAPGMSAAGVEPDLPAIAVNFDGSEGGLKGCLAQVAKLIGGYFYFENLTLYLFLTAAPGDLPDAIDTTPGRFLHTPPIKLTTDKSQVRTRVYGKGANANLGGDVDAGTPILPLTNAAMFNPSGGQAIAALTADTPPTQILNYTGVQLGGGGGLVGPGAAPSAAPGVSLLTGPGIDTGLHGYAQTFVTALGESMPSPIASIQVGVTPSPTTAPLPGTPTLGGAIDAGTHMYGATFVTPAGETDLTVASAVVTIPANVANPPMGTFTNSFSNLGTGGPYPFPSGGGPWYWAYTFLTVTGETLPSPIRGGNTGGGGPFYAHGTLPIGPAGVIARRIYRSPSGGATSPLKLATHIPNNTATLWEDKATSLGADAPTVNTTAPASVPLSAIPTGSALVTARKLYRYSGTLGWKLLDTIPNNTATTYTDTKANAALGAAPPVTNTAFANQVALTLALGGPTVTGRKVYRTAAGQAQLKLLTTIANNTATTATDAAADTTLGANAPTSDASGLTQPTGQILPGATTILVANTTAFSPAGGWAVVGNGEQVIRYSGITASSLTGVPPSGVGALVAAVSYNSTITASPALTGVTGLAVTLLKGAALHVWIQRDDVPAQANMMALDGGGNGLYDHVVSDQRRSQASLTQLCDADLEQFSRPMQTIRYACRDSKTKSGKQVVIALPSPAINATLLINEVTITELGTAPTNPRYTVVASSVHQSLDAILRILIGKAGQ